MTIYKTQCSLTLNNIFETTFYFAAFLLLDCLLFLQVRFALWQSIKRNAAWLWKNVFETTYYFAAFLRLDCILLLQVYFTAWQFIKFISPWLLQNRKLFVPWKWLKRRLTARCTAHNSAFCASVAEGSPMSSCLLLGCGSGRSFSIELLYISFFFKSLFSICSVRKEF